MNEDIIGGILVDPANPIKCESCQEEITSHYRHYIMDEQRVYVFCIPCTSDILSNFVRERDEREQHIHVASQRFNNLYNENK